MSNKTWRCFHCDEVFLQDTDADIKEEIVTTLAAIIREAVNS